MTTRKCYWSLSNGRINPYFGKGVSLLEECVEPQINILLVSWGRYDMCPLHIFLCNLQKLFLKLVTIFSLQRGDIFRRSQIS